SNNFSKLSNPMAQAIGSPMADHREYLPPTQSQNTNILSGSIPNSATASEFVDKATKCLATVEPSWACSKNQLLAEWALVIVSWVVNVLEAIKNKVVSGSNPFNVSEIWVPSTLETK